MGFLQPVISSAHGTYGTYEMKIYIRSKGFPLSSISSVDKKDLLANAALLIYLIYMYCNTACTPYFSFPLRL